MHDTDDTYKPVCPRCGHTVDDDADLWRGTGTVTETECGECAETFVVERFEHVTYSTRLTDADPSQPRSLWQSPDDVLSGDMEIP